MRPWIKNLPNWLTFIRLGLIPIFVALLVDATPITVLLASVIFIIAAITDYVDGYLARRVGAVSEFGKLLDPLADKILVMAALVMLASQRSESFGDPWVPGWMVVLTLAREIWVTGLRGLAAQGGVVVAANSSGKVKSGLQMVAVVALLQHDLPLELWGVRVTAQWVGLNLLMLSLFFSYWAAIGYTMLVLGIGGEQRTDSGRVANPAFAPRPEPLAVPNVGEVNPIAPSALVAPKASPDTTPPSKEGAAPEVGFDEDEPTTVH